MASAARGRDSVLASEQQEGCQRPRGSFAPSPPKGCPWRGKAGAPLDVPADHWDRISQLHVPEGKKGGRGWQRSGRRAGDRERHPPMSAPPRAAPRSQAAADVCTERDTSPALPRGPHRAFLSLKQAVTHVCGAIHVYIWIHIKCVMKNIHFLRRNAEKPPKESSQW